MLSEKLVQMAIECANHMYGNLEDLNDILNELIEDENINENERLALLECLNVLNKPEFLDELVARLGCIDMGEDK